MNQLPIGFIQPREGAGAINPATVAEVPPKVPKEAEGNVAEVTMKDLLDAKIDTVEARMEGHVKNIETLISGMSGSLKDMKETLQHETESRKSDRNTILGTVVGSVVAVVATVIGGYFSLASTNTGLVQAVIAAFQVGQANPPPAPPMQQGPQSPQDSKRDPKSQLPSRG